MKYCSKCGNQIGDEISFCSRCGAMVGQVHKVQSGNPVIDAIKKLGSSPLFLTAVIAYTIAIILSPISSALVSGSPAFMSYIYQMEEIFGSDYYPLYYFMNSSEGAVLRTIVTLITTFIEMIPVILIATGLWIIFISARDRKSDRIRTTGFTIIKVIIIISLVFLCLWLAVAELFLLIAFVIAANNYYGASVVSVFGVLMVIIPLCFTIGIVYYVKVIKTLNTVKRAATTAVPCERVSRFVGICCFISATISAIGSVNVISNLISGYGFMFTLFLSGICNAVSSASFGILIFKYRKRMTEIIKI